MDDNQLSLDGLDIDPNIIRKAWGGDSQAQLEVGSAYFASVYVKDNLLIASKWISRSAEQDNMEAQFRLGDLYALGQGVEQSFVDAYQWYTKSAIQGYKKALRRIHNLYEQDKKIHCRGKLNAEEELKQIPRFLGEEEKYYYRELNEQRLDEQKHILSDTINYYSQSFQKYKSLDQDDPVVQVNLAFHYQHGYGTFISERWAIEYYTKASEKGHRDAQYNLGYIYQLNTKIKFNYRLSFKWLWTSAANGSVAAQNSLAYLYEKGLGTDINHESAVYWYTKAAMAGNSDAQMTLGKWYRKGEYVQKDLSEAVKWYRLAARQGNGMAQSCLNQLNEEETYLHLRDTSKKPTLSSRLQDDLNKLTGAGHFETLQKLCYHARRSDGNAMYQIGLKYYNGEDFTQNKDTGFQWIKKAAKAGIQIAVEIIAHMYEVGDMIDQDYHESSKWVRKSAIKKNSEAQCKLGTFFKNGFGVRRYPFEASKWFTFSADQGNGEAWYQLGLLRLKNHIVFRNQMEAFYYFQQSARFGNPSGTFELGKCYENEIFVERNMPIAIQLYKDAARSGNSAAQIRLGQLYEYGNVIASDLEQAEKYYTMASDSGITTYQVDLAKKYLDGTFPDGDYVKTFNLIKHASKQNHRDAIRLFQTPITLGETDFDLRKIIDMFRHVTDRGIEDLEYNIGFAYEHGITGHSKFNTIPVDYVSAEVWYSIGARKGDSRAQCRLGIMYAEGKGVEQNLSKGFSYYSRAHENGNSDATYMLAKMYLSGYGVDQDLVKAYHFFTEASNSGNKEAHIMLSPSNSSGNLEMLEKIAILGNVAIQYQLGILHQVDNEALAFKWFSSAAKGGITDACYRVGVFYQEGRGTDRDYSKAIKFYEGAADKDHEGAMYRLAQLYLHGIGKVVNYEKAYHFYTMAAKKGHYLSRKVLNIANQPFSVLYDEIDNESSGVDLGSKNMDHSFSSNLDKFEHSILMYNDVAEKGDAEAQYTLGLFFENNPSACYSEALKWYTMSSGSSHPRGIYRLGLLYEKGLGVRQNYHKAAQLYKLSSDLGNFDAMYRLAKLHYFGKGMDVDLRKAVNYYTLAACSGKSEAQLALGRIYQYGKLIRPDFLEALKWLTRSHMQGDNDASISLFQFYDHEPFKHYFHKRLFSNMEKNTSFITLKNTDYRKYILFLDYEKTGSAMYILGRSHLFGLSTKKNWLKAWEYLTAATKEYGYPDEEDLIDLVLSKNIFELRGRLDEYTQFYVGRYYYLLARKNKAALREDRFDLGGVDPTITQGKNTAFGYYQKAMDCFSPLASGEDKEAQYYLGKMYLNGYGTEVNKQLAVTWYSVAAEQKHIDAQYELGMLYFTGVDYDIDYRLSLRFIKEAALSGHRKAIFHIGWMFKHGLGFTKSEEEAAKWFNVSLSSMQIQSSYDFNMSDLIEDIKRLEVENLNASVEETNLETLSYNGDGAASYSLSQKFLNGKDVEVNRAKGLNYLRLGAFQGHHLCQEELAFLFYHGGDSVRKDLRLATLWLKRGEEYGSIKLKFYLAQIYHSGVVDNNDFGSALKLYQVIDGEFFPLVLQQKGLLYENGNGLKADYSMAYRYYMKSFNEGNFISGYNIALLYFYGNGVKQDYTEAISWLEKSRAKSTLTHLHYVLLEIPNVQAVTTTIIPRKTYSLVTYDQFLGEILYLLGRIYYDGLGVYRNNDKFQFYFKQASEKGNEKAKSYLRENPQ